MPESVRWTQHYVCWDAVIVLALTLEVGWLHELDAYDGAVIAALNSASL